MTVPARRPWHRRKRTWAALALWLLVTYPISQGPATYFVVRGWLSPGLFLGVYGPMAFVAYPEPLERATGVYRTWWRDQAWRDMGRL